MINSMTSGNGHIETVVPDELALAIEAAKARIEEVYANDCQTLIDRFSQADWETRDGSNEPCLIEDPSCFDDEIPRAA